MRCGAGRRLVPGGAGWAGFEVHGSLKADGLLKNLLRAETTKVPDIVKDMVPYRRWLNPRLSKANQDAEAKQEAHKQLHTSLALLAADSGQVDDPPAIARRRTARGPRASGLPGTAQGGAGGPALERRGTVSPGEGVPAPAGGLGPGPI